MARFFLSCFKPHDPGAGRHDAKSYLADKPVDRYSHYVLHRDTSHPKIPRTIFYLLNTDYAEKSQLGSYQGMVSRFVLALVYQVIPIII